MTPPRLHIKHSRFLWYKSDFQTLFFECEHLEGGPAESQMKSWPLIGLIERDTTIKHMTETTGHRPPAGPRLHALLCQHVLIQRYWWDALTVSVSLQGMRWRKASTDCPAPIRIFRFFFIRKCWVGWKFLSRNYYMEIAVSNIYKSVSRKIH